MNLSYRDEKNAKFIAETYKKPLDKPDWYNISAVSEEEAEVFIYDYIGWPYNDANEFVRSFANLKQSKITVRVNSPGGDVFDGFAIANAIKFHSSKPTTRIEALAASAASYIAVSGHEKQAYKNAMIMIHEPSGGCWGNQYDMREIADVLAQINSNMVDMYIDNTSVGKREVQAMLKAETWMTAKQAKEKGFIDTIIEAGSSAQAAFDLSIFANVPDEFKIKDQILSKIDPTNIRDVEKVLRDAGLSKEKAKALLARGFKAAISDIDTDNDSGDIESAETLLKAITRK